MVGAAAGGLEVLRTGLVEPAMERGWRVAVTLTPSAGNWLRPNGEFRRLESVTGFPVRVEQSLPGTRSPHPKVDCYVVAPATANTVAKLAAGMADNQALTQVGEAMGTLGLPVVVFPRVNAAHARHPAWKRHLDALREAEVHLVYGPDVWPLYEPREAPPVRALPWGAILDAVDQVAR